MKNREAPKSIDLFCGCGGLSAGLRSAGYEVIAGVDNDHRLMSSFKRNFPEALHIEADLSEYAPHDLMEMVGVEPMELDLLVGGPPCQGFSKNVPRSRRSADSAGNLLVHRFIDFCEELRPKSVLMENVAEMKNGFSRKFTDEIFMRLDAAGYSVNTIVLNAAQFGVPQMRKRTFVLATRLGHMLMPPAPTHTPLSKQTSLGGVRGNDYVNVWDAIGDLPSVRHGEGWSEAEYSSLPFSDFQRQVRSEDGTVKNHEARQLRSKQFARLSSLKPGQGHKDLPDTLKVRATYSGAYGRLTKEMVAPTITRWVFHPGSGRWGHPVDIRTLTIREAARIQGFHDDFEFVGSFVQQAGQVGNAVPPMLAKALGSSMRHQLGI